MLKSKNHKSTYINEETKKKNYPLDRSKMKRYIYVNSKDEE